MHMRPDYLMELGTEFEKNSEPNNITDQTSLVNIKREAERTMEFWLKSKLPEYI